MNKKAGFSILFLAIAAMAAIHLAIPRARADADNTFMIDVALDANTYVQNNVNPSEASTSFSRGDTFILGGTIYPAGTLPSGIANNDPNAPGGVGKITCRGTYLIGLNDSANATLWTDTTELYLLPDDSTQLIADGRTPNVMGATVDRSLLGGTGRFRGATGEVHELELGANASGFCNLRITFHLKSND